MTDKLKKLMTLKSEPALAVFDAIEELNDNVKALIEVTRSSKSEVVSVDNLADAKTDLSPLERGFVALQESMDGVKVAIQAIPQDKEMDMSGIEKLLGQIAEKDVKMTEIKNISDILDNVLFAVQTMASHSSDKEEVLAPDIKKIQEILNLLNENVASIEIPGFDYEKLAEIIRDNVKTGGGMGPASVNIKDVAGNAVNPATEEKQDELITNTTVGTLSPENSTVVPLGIGGVFTGTAIDTKDFVTVNVVVKASHASATDGLCIDFSSDGTNWDIIECHTIPAGVGQAHLSRAKARYMRVRFTNGGTAQTYFRLATLLKNTAVSMTYEQLSIDVDDTHDAALVRAVLAAKKPNGDYVNIRATTGGNLKISLEEIDPASNIATESTLQAVLAAQGGSVYNYIQNEETATYKYYGYASSTGWKIKRKTLATGIWMVAEGTGDYDTAFADRANKVYAYT